MATGVLSALVGISISYVADLPSGPTIVAVNAALLCVVFVIRRRV
jgi:ABC-type Mn2+/Zn2+ transport system permease subunit